MGRKVHSEEGQPTKKFFILGGYGNTGVLISKLLLRETPHHVVIAGRSHERAEEVALRLSQLFKGERVTAACVNAADEASLKSALDTSDMIVVASATAHFTKEIARAALGSGTDYIDLQISREKLNLLEEMSEEIERSGRCFITEGGFHPGLPAALVRYAGDFFDELESANVGSLIKIDWKNITVADSTAYELVGMIPDFQLDYFEEGEWKTASALTMKGFRKFDFGGDFVEELCTPMFMQEMQSLPQIYPSLEETGFFVAGFNRVVDWLIMPLIMVAMRVSPKKMLRPMAGLLGWGLDRFSKPPFITILKLEAKGRKEGSQLNAVLSLRHEDGYFFTAVPVVACLLQYLDGSIRTPGLKYMAHLVDPKKLLSDMERMGIRVKSTFPDM